MSQDLDLQFNGEALDNLGGLQLSDERGFALLLRYFDLGFGGDLERKLSLDEVLTFETYNSEVRKRLVWLVDQMIYEDIMKKKSHFGPKIMLLTTYLYESKVKESNRHRELCFKTTPFVYILIYVAGMTGI